MSESGSSVKFYEEYQITVCPEEGPLHDNPKEEQIKRKYLLISQMTYLIVRKKMHLEYLSL